MIILKIDQDSPEWHELRRLNIGASDAPCICGVDPYKKAEKLFRQKMTGEKQYVSPQMERGKRLEITARRLLEKVNGCKYEPIVVRDEEFDFMIASLDGYDAMKGIGIEIKCPNEKLFNSIVLDHKIPKSYIYQIQHQMRVTGLSKWTLVPFNGLYFEEIEIERDEDIINEIIEKERHFYACMQNMEWREYES